MSVSVKNIFNDEGSKLVGEYFALIYTPQKKRARFPENCVHIMASEAEAIAGADASKHLYPGRVAGPSRSSEGFRLYYLIEWLDG
ncbi:MAG: hypothetical protein Q8N54_09110 [Sulfurimicrobium sp.]|jgi:hypothetical protein|nr:hypothetical protein [Sulfurimicrobium sp.]MDP1703981.1 hypothetical protein [Sulfurimicrobium sp.]MDP2200044.1 hypothetical protein [Sulfurimicrobium sp.]MDP2962904.1 hypothetical protein [Sulfurimicrobium sp.]MDP3686102.1 hypothetical protein [Sulfurimicrobium sp.]